MDNKLTWSWDPEADTDMGPLIIERYRTKGKGVNETPNAIRITHHKTGLRASSESKFNAHFNREHALGILQGLLKEFPETDLKFTNYWRPGQRIVEGVAIEITHIPTGTTARSSKEDMAYLNRADAMAKLQEKLAKASEKMPEEKMPEEKMKPEEARWLLAKYTPDLERNEPRNIGVILRVGDSCLSKFLPAEAVKVRDLDNYKDWVHHWENTTNLKTNGAEYRLERAGSRLLGEIPDPTKFLQELFDRLVKPKTTGATNVEDLDFIFVQPHQGIPKGNLSSLYGIACDRQGCPDANCQGDCKPVPYENPTGECGCCGELDCDGSCVSRVLGEVSEELLRAHERVRAGDLSEFRAEGPCPDCKARKDTKPTRMTCKDCGTKWMFVGGIQVVSTEGGKDG